MYFQLDRREPRVPPVQLAPVLPVIRETLDRLDIPEKPDLPVKRVRQGGQGGQGGRGGRGGQGGRERLARLDALARSAQDPRVLLDQPGQPVSLDVRVQLERVRRGALVTVELRVLQDIPVQLDIQVIRDVQDLPG